MAGRRFVIGDIHGAHRALLQCFGRSGFNRDTDLLISLGDLCDGWPDVRRVFDELLGIRNRILILGNHDEWLLQWFETGAAPDIWLTQGGSLTIRSFKDRKKDKYLGLLKESKLFHVIENKLFVHGGFSPDIPLEQQERRVLLWDRTLVSTALNLFQAGEDGPVTSYDTVYVGHTPTINYGWTQPFRGCGICMMDTGAGWPGGVLTIMDIDSGETYRSDVINLIYSLDKGRT
jgi:serine/threonine protein phosphatase 1